MRISVAVSTCEGERFLGSQLESICAQTRPPDELALFDDASTDGTVALARSFTERAGFPMQVVVNDQRLGFSRNVERAVNACAGDLIVLADQDDVWDPNKLEHLARANERAADTWLAITDGDLVGDDGNQLSGSLWHRLGLEEPELRSLQSPDGFATVLDRVLRTGGFVPGASMGFTRAIRDLAVPFPEWMPERGKGLLLHDAWIALLAAGSGSVVVVPELLSHYRLHTTQQVGLSAGPARSRPSRASTRHRLAGQLVWMAAVADRLATSAGGARVNALTELQERAAHLRVRGGLSRRRVQRISPVLRELCTGRYQRYSRGFASIAHDLLGTDDGGGASLA